MPAQNPRDVRSSEFPTAAPVESQLKFLVNYAIFAPSLYNTQPWSFRILDHTVDIYADRSRGLAVVDSEDRYLTISCAAAIQLFETALKAFGFDFESSLYPDLNDPDLLGRITVRSNKPDHVPDEDMLRAIVNRTTIRRGFRSQSLPSAFRDGFVTRGHPFGVHLQVIESEDAQQLLLDHLLELERIQWEDAHFRREVESWMHPMRERTRDGVPVHRGEPLGPYLWGKYSEAPADATMLVALMLEADTPRAWVEAGRTLMQKLVEASMHGVGAAIIRLMPISVLVRSALCHSAACTGEPVLLLRFGYPLRRYITSRRTSVDFMRPPGSVN